MIYNPFTLDGKTILITGASSGIGRTTAIECSKMGAKLIITGRSMERLKITYENLQGKDHIYICADLTDDLDIDRLVSETPLLDGSFFCAGVTDTTLVKFYNREKIDRVLNINLVSPALLTKALLKKKKIKDSASLVYMSSYGVEQMAYGLGIYAASKAGLNALVHAIALENSSKKIRANSIMPSMVRTELLDTLQSFDKETLEKDEQKYPLGYGRPEDIAYAAIYLLSDASRWVTGSQLKMDGGSVL